MVDQEHYFQGYLIMDAPSTAMKIQVKLHDYVKDFS